jgi:hypothetical protein
MPDDDRREADFLDELRETSLESAVQQLRLIHELKERARRAAGLEAPPPAEQAPPGTTTGDVLFDIARLSLNYYNQWLKLSARHFDHVVDALLHPAGQPVAEPRRPARLLLHASGPRRGAAAARFLIENPLSTAAEVSFSIPSFRAAGGGDPFQAAVTFARVETRGGAPGGGFRLEPRQSGAFRLTVRLDEPFAAGRRYAGEAWVLADGRVVGQLVLELEVTAAERS